MLYRLYARTGMDRRITMLYNKGKSCGGAGRISAADGASAGAMHRCSLYFYEAMGAKKCYIG